MLALCPSEPRQNCGGWTPYSVWFSCSNLRGSSSGMEPAPLWEVPEEEQAAHSDPSTLLLDRDRNPPTFQNDPCIGHWHTHAGFSIFASIAGALHSELARRMHIVRSTLLCPYVQHIAYIGYCTCFHAIFFFWGKKEVKNNSIVPEILLIGSPRGCTRSAFQCDLTSRGFYLSLSLARR